jgi:hypothetical protein
MTKRKTWWQKLIALVFGDKLQLIEQNEEYRFIIEDLTLLRELEQQSTRYSDKIGAVTLAQILLVHYTSPGKMDEHLNRIVSNLPLDLRTETLNYLDELRVQIESEIRAKRCRLRLVDKEPLND